jgi:prepilin-type N-terminal cleavage/methylation domain-containing protein
MSSRSIKLELGRGYPQRGFTLVEILVASSIALLLLGVIVNLLVQSTRISLKGANQVELQQRAMMVGDRLANDLRTTTGAGLGAVDNAGEKFITIHPRQAEVGPVGWQQKVVVYAWNSPYLQTYSFSLNPPPSDAYKPPLSVLTGLGNSDKKVTLNIEGVTRLDFVVESGPLVKLGLTFEKDDQKAVLDRVVLLRQGD